MHKKPQKSRSKPYFCFDENLQFIELNKKCNKYARFESFVKLMKQQGAKDEQAIKECNKADKHIITHNTKDFKQPASNIKVGIICVGLNSEEDWIPKLIKVFKVLPKHENYYYKTIFIANAITIKDRETDDIRVL